MIQETSDSQHSTYQTRIRETIIQLYDAGMNIIPFSVGLDAPDCELKRFNINRLPLNHPSNGLLQMTQESSNIAVLCGRTSGNLFVIVVKSEARLHHYRTMFDKNGIPFFVSTNGNEEFFIWLCCKEGEVFEIPPGVMVDAEVLGKSKKTKLNQWVIAPPSIQSTGEYFAWYERQCSEPPTIHLEQLAWLTDKRRNRIRLEVKSKRSYKNPTIYPYTWTWLLLKLFERFSDSIDASFADQIEWSVYREYRAEVEAVNHVRSLVKELEITPSDLRSVMKEIYIEERIEAEHMPEYFLEWQQAYAYVISRAWKGRTRMTDLYVAKAFVARARKALVGGMIRASQREIASEAHLEDKPARNAIHRLCGKKGEPAFIAHDLEDKDKLSGAFLYYFTDAVLDEGQRLLVDNYHNKATVLTDLDAKLLDMTPLEEAFEESSISEVFLYDSDGFEHGSAGKVGDVIYRMLLKYDRLTVAEICQKTGLSRGQVDRRLKKTAPLVVAGAVERIGKYRKAHYLTKVEFDQQIAQPTSKFGANQKRIRRRVKERENRLASYVQSKRFGEKTPAD